MPVRIEEERVYLSGKPSQALKEELFSAFDQVKRNTSALEALQLIIRGPALLKSPCFFFMKTEQREEEKVLYPIGVRINPSTLQLHGEDYSDLLPVLLLHEYEEMWMYAKPGFSLSWENPDHSALAHRHALHKQYEEAFKQGKADRCLTYMIAMQETYRDTRMIEELPVLEKYIEWNREAYAYWRRRNGNTDHV